MNELVLIKSNPFEIPSRIKNIDEDYEIFYNKKHLRFELHNMRFNPTFQIVLPFDNLDCRVVDYVLATRLEKRLVEIERIDADNELLEEKLINAKYDEMQNKSKSLINYLDRGGSEIPPWQEL